MESKKNQNQNYISHEAAENRNFDGNTKNIYPPLLTALEPSVPKITVDLGYHQKKQHTEEKRTFGTNALTERMISDQYLKTCRQ